MPAVMIQATGSDAGKSVLTAGLCRLFTNRGLRVRPFKPQNMSNNAAVAADGGEIGRAQALQAIACRVPPSVDMNPVLIKPQSDRTAQLVVHGRVHSTMGTGFYREQKRALLQAVMESYERLRASADLVIVEGAGSPAEINLRAGDIANMGFAREAGVPVILVGDIDRGGVVASLVGTRAVLDPADAEMIRGFLINKFRGDVELFREGYEQIERRTGWEGLGVVPWLAAARRLPEEDGVALERPQAPGAGALVIAVPMLPRISNLDDFDPLREEPGVRLVMVPPETPLPSDAALVILPGTKATIADLQFLRLQGWDIDLAAHIRRGGRVLGICGGYQMLGRWVADPEGVEGVAGKVPGLGYLPVDTVLTGEKRVTVTRGVDVASGTAFEGYEIHTGRTTVDGHASPLLRFEDGTADGVVSSNGRIGGCYVHGLFNQAGQRAMWLARLGAKSDGVDQSARVDESLDELASALERSVNIERIVEIARTARQ